MFCADNRALSINFGTSERVISFPVMTFFDIRSLECFEQCYCMEDKTGGLTVGKIQGGNSFPEVSSVKPIKDPKDEDQRQGEDIRPLVSRFPDEERKVVEWRSSWKLQLERRALNVIA